jgi:hypothetical protein
VKDAFVLVRRGDEQTAVHVSDAIDQDRLNQHVLGYRVEVTDPLHQLRIVLDETEGMAEHLNITLDTLASVLRELAAQGIVTEADKGLRIVDIEALETFADAA